MCRSWVSGLCTNQLATKNNSTIYFNKSLMDFAATYYEVFSSYLNVIEVKLIFALDFFFSTSSVTKSVYQPFSLGLRHAPLPSWLWGFILNSVACVHSCACFSSYECASPAISLSSSMGTNWSLWWESTDSFTQAGCIKKKKKKSVFESMLGL